MQNDQIWYGNTWRGAHFKGVSHIGWQKKGIQPVKYRALAFPKGFAVGDLQGTWPNLE